MYKKELCTLQSKSNFITQNPIGNKTVCKAGKNVGLRGRSEGERGVSTEK
jgi:hypothetical protein